MQIEDNKVVAFHYTLSESGHALESSQGKSPMVYLHGHNNMMPALEKEMIGKTVGDAFSVTLTPEQAYGVRKEGQEQKVPLKHLQGPAAKSKKWQAGMMATIHTEQGQHQVTVTKVGKFSATVDFNHPLAGKTLTFDVAIEDVRDATPDEQSHGHAHGPGGHHH